MKPTTKQIEQIKSINAYSTTRFHGNKKKVGTLNIKEYLKIVEIKMQREMIKCNEVFTNIQLIKQLIKDSVNYVGTPYRKIMLEGNTGIYFASPDYLHQDFNKTRLFDKNETTLKLMNIYNALAAK